MKTLLADDFWSPRLDLNRSEALIYQWEQYGKCGTLGNFQLVADRKQGGRRGFFYTDSDLHKWADAVSRTLSSGGDQRLEGLLGEYIELMARAQEPDGYLFTWNQLIFPGMRWINLHIEHELYTLGHFIEAGISHLQATGETRLYDLAIKAADLVVRDFGKITASNCPGHQEIEIALLKLFQVTGEQKYLDTAEQFLRRRGTGWLFGLKLLLNLISHGKRNKEANRRAGRDGARELGFDITETRHSREPRFLGIRAFFSFISGSYHQQHRALIEQTEPRGHAVRWAYMMYAAAILSGVRKAADLDELLVKSWEHLVKKKMYITGGIGALPLIEGFGRNHELSNEFSYSETCAAIGSIFWNNEMLKHLPQARFADLVERQLYNAASVGISQDGKKYFYRNPLESNGELERLPWFQTACCPSNISRLWADIPKLICRETDGAVYVNQYIGSRVRFEEKELDLELKSGFPWEGRCQIKLDCARQVKLNLRIPGWAQAWQVLVNGELFAREAPEPSTAPIDAVYTDLMNRARYLELELRPGAGQVIELEIPMEITVNRSDPRVKENRGKVALSRGPLVYCIESEKEIDRAVDLAALRPERDEQSPGRTVLLSDGTTTLLPYFLWGNQGKKKMKVWVNGA